MPTIASATARPRRWPAWSRRASSPPRAARCWSRWPSAWAIPRQVREEEIGAASSARSRSCLTLGLCPFQKYVVRPQRLARHQRRHGALQHRSRGDLAIGVGALPVGPAGRAADRQRRRGPAWRSTCCMARWKVGRESLDVLMDRELPVEDRQSDRRHRAGASRGDGRARSAHAVGRPHQVHPAPHRARPAICRWSRPTPSATRGPGRDRQGLSRRRDHPARRSGDRGRPSSRP